MPGYKLHMLLKRPCPAGLLPMLAMVLLRETQAWTSATSLKLSGNAILTGFCRLGSKTLKLFKIGSLLPLPHRKWAEVTETVKGRRQKDIVRHLSKQQGEMSGNSFVTELRGWAFQCTLFLQEFISLQNNKNLFLPCSAGICGWGFGRRKGLCLCKGKSPVVTVFLVSQELWLFLIVFFFF